MLARYLVQHVLGRAGIGIEGKADGDIVLHNAGFVWKALLGGGSIALGEAYMRGDWECGRMDIFFEKMIRSGLATSIPNMRERVIRFASRFVDLQSPEKSKRVGTVHYDIPPAFYERVLGRTMNYTSAVWEGGAQRLDDAQMYKMDLVARKLPHLGSKRRVLDIGCGWGALMGHLAAKHGASCVGVSISREQIEYAKEVYAGTNHDLAFHFCDYRDFGGQVDDVVSICMIEQVGINNLPTYFKKVSEVMSDSGTFVLQAILAKDARIGFDGFLEKYIFPGGVLPTLAHIRDASREVLHLHDVHEFPMSYYQTLMAWYENMHRHRDWVIDEMGSTFFRMFEFYLMMCAGAFKSGRITVAQMVFSKHPDTHYQSVR